MLAFVAIVGIVGFAQIRGEKPISSRLPAPAHPLSKPEPGILLTRTDLSLTTKQRSAIQAVESAWLRDQAKLLTAMSGYEPKQGRADQISGSLQGYSELSRNYDATRSRYWTAACAQLDANQRSLVEGGSR
ncbi:MAG: hypothetical protein ACHQ50_02965 [Fimbriimonadales bacterium]